ncbi:adenylyltransferase and sulfurtransferase MOCS3 [Polypterus senegalus]|uniref:adenylyltransferase and sulfurtransferase MOCS3 n=1 Tax=Polypterus senegalus TaxID=55291 RepID=UPI0019658383|nr:adenylyltransferase and sulfurtransferase MOCS3 [Polypterus senegalus]
MEQDVARIIAELTAKEKEVADLKAKLESLQKDSHTTASLHPMKDISSTLDHLRKKASLNNDEIMRYSRQLLLPEFGVKGQVNLLKTSVLIVGCGGLGCPVAQYLASAGIGRLGLLDYDTVELSNLHRQVLHGENRIGWPKAFSAAESLKRLNSTVECIPYHVQLTPENAMQLIQQYDIVADCSDNVPTRYLVNDACVLSGKPLVSASALRLEGQLTVYNYKGGPCYRCLYAKPPPPETVTSCSDGGVLGVVPGIMGCFQALEILKIASGKDSSYHQQMLLFDALEGRFRTIRLRPKQNGCVVCGEEPTVQSLVNYEQFCGSTATDKCRRLSLLTSDKRIAVQEYKRILDDKIPHLLLDVRPLVEFNICCLSFSINIPLSNLEHCKPEDIALLKEKMREYKRNLQSPVQVYVVCKNGNDSQKAVCVLQKMSGSELDSLEAKDIQGGLMAWAEKIDTKFPQY